MNTGYLAWSNLEEYFIDTGTSTGRVKPNVSGDPDYVAPVLNETACPIVDSTFPTFPTPLTTTILSDTSIQLDWVSSDNVGVDTQEVYWRVFGGSYAAIGVNSGSTSYIKTGLTAGTTYNFYIRACDAASNCTDSGVRTETTTGGVTTYIHQLGYDNSIASNACVDPPNTYYTDNANFGNSTKIWINASGTFTAPSGYYSDGSIILQWNGSAVIGSSFCQF